MAGTDAIPLYCIHLHRVLLYLELLNCCPSAAAQHRKIAQLLPVLHPI